MPSLKNLLLTGTMTVASAVAGTVATNKSVDSSWYEDLNKPSWFPPRAAFPVAWTTLFATIALTTASALDDAETASERRRLIGALALNLGLNAGWCVEFFDRHRLANAVPVAGALALSSADLTRRVAKNHGGRGALLLAYPLWCTFATVLSDAVARRNPDSDADPASGQTR